MRVRPGAILLGAIGLVGGTGGVLAMREATLSTHQAVGKDSEAVIELRAEERDLEGGRTLAGAVEALLQACRYEVDSSEVVEIVDHGDDRYTAVLRPGLDQTNQRQLRGCLEDWSMDHLRVDVLRITGH